MQTTASKKTKTVYFINYKHPEHGSDRLGCEFISADAASREIAIIETDPGQAGYADWMKGASMWVTDDKGNIY